MNTSVFTDLKRGTVSTGLQSMLTIEGGRGGRIDGENGG